MTILIGLTIYTVLGILIHVFETLIYGFMFLFVLVIFWLPIFWLIGRITRYIFNL